MTTGVLRFILAVLLAFASTLAFAVEILKWDRIPLNVPLRVDDERIIFLDRNVRVGLERPVSDRLRIQSAGGAIYIKALDEVPKSRLQVQVIESGELILIDLYTVESDSPIDTSDSIRIVDDRAVSGDVTPDGHDAKVTESLKIPAPVALTRYASQSLYAPLRTVEPVPGLRKVGIRVHNRLRLFPTESIAGTPLVAYKLGAYTVTAIKLVNTSPNMVDLDPRKLQGDFHSATFQHNWLGSAGTAEDTTVVYLVTVDRGLDKALLPLSHIPEVPVEKNAVKSAEKKTENKSKAKAKKENG